MTSKKMMTKTSDDEQMLKAFDKFKGQIDQAYGVVREFLEEGDFNAAQQLLAKIGQTHAKTSLSLRNYLIRSGRIPAPSKEE